MMRANTEHNNTWIKTRAFETVVNDNFLKHELEYKQSGKNAVMTKIKLLGYADGELKVFLYIDKPKYKCVTDILVSEGFPQPEKTDGYIGLYQMPIPNIQYLRDFLATVACADPTVNLIAPEIIRTATPHAKEEPTLRGWVKENDFNYLRIEHNLIRSEEYHSTLPASKITHLKLLGYRDGEITLSINIQKNQYAIVTEAMIAAGFPQPLHLNTFTHICRTVIKSEADLKRLLTALSSVEISVIYIADHLLVSYRQAAEIPSMYARPFMMFAGNDFDTSANSSMFDDTPSMFDDMPLIDPTPSDDDRFQFPTIRHYK